MSSGFFSKWLKVSLVALVGAGFLAIVVYAFWMKEEIKSASVEPPLVAASDVPVKHRPDEPGGMNIPNRDKVVFDLLDASPTSAVSGVVAPGAEVSSASPAAPAPEAVVVAVSPSLAVAPVLAEVSDEKVVAPAAVVPVKPVLASAAVVKVAAAVVSPVAVKKEVMVAKMDVVSTPAKEQPEVKKIKDSAVKVEDKKDAPMGKKWGVQLAAVGSKVDAEKMVVSLKAKNALLKPLSAKVAQAGPAKFRVQFWGLKDKNAAVSLCSKVSPCFPVAP